MYPYDNSDEIYEELGKYATPPRNNDPGYYSSEHYMSEYGRIGSIPNAINGKRVAELIESGELTPENISDEQRQTVFKDIMAGVTNNTNLLAQKIDLIISDKDLVWQMIANQYNIAVERIRNERHGVQYESIEDRTFQFLATMQILMEKGYNLEELKFKTRDKEIDIQHLVANFMRECSGSRSIKDPTWFKDGAMPANYDMRLVHHPWSFSCVLLTNMHTRNPEYFETTYENYIKNTNMTSPYSYEDYMFMAFGINKDYLQRYAATKSAVEGESLNHQSNVEPPKTM